LKRYTEQTLNGVLILEISERDDLTRQLISNFDVGIAADIIDWLHHAPSSSFSDGFLLEENNKTLRRSISTEYLEYFSKQLVQFSKDVSVLSHTLRDV